MTVDLSPNLLSFTESLRFLPQGKRPGVISLSECKPFTDLPSFHSTVTWPSADPVSTLTN